MSFRIIEGTDKRGSDKRGSTVVGISLFGIWNLGLESGILLKNHGIRNLVHDFSWCRTPGVLSPHKWSGHKWSGWTNYDNIIGPAGPLMLS